MKSTTFRHAILYAIPFLLCASGSAGARSLADLAQAHYQAEWAAGPVSATQLGVHQGDSRLDDVSLAGIAAQTKRLHAEQAEIAALDAAGLSPRERDDRDVLAAAIGRELLANERIQPFHHDPDSYISLATNAVYSLIDRDYAPPADRLRAVIAREQAIPAMLALAETQLADVPQVFLDIAREDLEGSFSFVSRDVPEAFAGVRDQALQNQLAASTKTTLAAFTRYKAFLGGLKATGSFVLGPDVMRALLAADLVDLPIDTVVAAGRAQLAKDKAAFIDIERRLDKAHPADSLVLVRHDHPPANQLIATATDQLHGLQDFVVSHHIATLPAMILPTVIETPPFQRALITAAMDWPGAFETSTRTGARTSFYYITPPSSAFTPEQIEQAMGDFNRPELEMTTAHEAMPGHFVQGLTLRAHPEWSLIRRAAQSYATTEGWAHYSEQMMVDEGFGGGDLKMRLMQLQDALLRDCRLVDAFGMQAQGMSLAEATSLMQTECFQSPMSAFKEARRGTEDPGYYSYTLGKLMILHLRDDMQRSQGAAFSLTRFHDALLGAGLVPMTIIRRELTGHDASML
ncbi:MAG: DUF885 domain-containing protein [Janthinobacterium lividum]